MLRTYKPIQHEIFTLHGHLEHLVCQVWCNANDNDSCTDLLEEDFEEIYNEYDWLKADVDAVYDKCKELSAEERSQIREAFNVNNRIEELCNGTLRPKYLNDLPSVVENNMKPLLVKFYNDLLDRVTVAGDKLEYYNALQLENDFAFCPCCGLVPIESAESHYREDNDHYFPKAEFPFASVNFKNLVPLCSKCNKKCKGSKNPIESDKVAFYPFSGKHDNVEVDISITDSESLDYRKLEDNDIQIHIEGDSNKIVTWDWLFEIKARYNEEVRKFYYTELRILANRIHKNSTRRSGLTYLEIIEDKIEEYEFEKYSDRKFLKIPFLKALLNQPDWMNVYHSFLNS